MQKRWAQPFKDRKELLGTIDSMGLAFHICWFLGAIFAILGIIAGALNTAVGLGPVYWFLLSLAAFLAGIPMLVTWAVAMNLLGIEAKKGR
jgi:hypothetical protein